MKNKTTKILNILHILAWILVIAMLVETGSFIFNMTYTLGFQPLAADYLKLTDLLAYSRFHFGALFSVMILAAALKTLSLYRIARIFDEKKLDLQLPFNETFGKFLFTLAYLCLATGVVCYFGAKYITWLSEQDVVLPNSETLRLAGADVSIFMGATLYVIALIFKRGVEMQLESEFTI